MQRQSVLFLQSSQPLQQQSVLLGQSSNLCLFFLHQLIKSLDGSQSYSIGIHRGDVTVVFADLKSLIELLSGGAYTANLPPLAL